MRVAYTMEQCWHDVPGGTAVATLRVATELTAHHGIDLIGVAGRHRRPPVAGFEPTIPVTTVPLARPLLYDAWIRLRWPLVESATGAVDLCHSTAGIPAPSRAPSKEAVAAPTMKSLGILWERLLIAVVSNITKV